jgi:triphosphoribosyl-dephospho-CoA synthase
MLAVAHCERHERWPSLDPQTIGRAATLALYDELALTPKPGLVTLIDNGSHNDMDAQTFMRSLFALRGYFVRIATLGSEGASFEALERCGIEAEARMIAVTGGINTHRGAIFMLGLLCAAAGAASVEQSNVHPSLVRETLKARWGHALRERAKRPARLPGGIAARRYGLRGASEEAAEGFPVLFRTALPALRAAKARGLPRQHALIDTLFSIIAVLDDSNIARRCGIEGLRLAQSLAAGFLHAGGAARVDGIAHAQRVGEQFVRMRLSPGGAADTLAAACWMQRLGILESTANEP